MNANDDSPSRRHVTKSFVSFSCVENTCFCYYFVVVNLAVVTKQYIIVLYSFENFTIFDSYKYQTCMVIISFEVSPDNRHIVNGKLQSIE